MRYYYVAHFYRTIIVIYVYEDRQYNVDVVSFDLADSGKKY